MSVISPAAASAFQQAQVLQQVNVAVARKSLDAAEQQGQASLKLLEAAADLARQQPANPPTLGSLLDVTG